MDRVIIQMSDLTKPGLADLIPLVTVHSSYEKLNAAEKFNCLNKLALFIQTECGQVLQELATAQTNPLQGPENGSE